MVVKTLVWNIWIVRNDYYIFNANVVPTHVLILKINHMLLSWFLATVVGFKVKLEDSILPFDKVWSS